MADEAPFFQSRAFALMLHERAVIERMPSSAAMVDRLLAVNECILFNGFESNFEMAKLETDWTTSYRIAELLGASVSATDALMATLMSTNPGREVIAARADDPGGHLWRGIRERDGPGRSQGRHSTQHMMLELHAFYRNRAYERCGGCLATCGPASMTCSACHIARFCSQACQKRAWPEHKKQCKMWVRADVSDDRILCAKLCCWCSTPEPEPKRTCSACGIVRFCNEECSTRGQKAHKAHCLRWRMEAAESA